MKSRSGRPPVVPKLSAKYWLMGVAFALLDALTLAACAATPPVCGLRISKAERRTPQPAPADLAALLIRGLPEAFWETEKNGHRAQPTSGRLRAVAACRGCDGSELLIEAWRAAGHGVRILPTPRLMGLSDIESRVPTWLVAVAYAETDSGFALAVMGRVQRRRRNLIAEHVSHVALPGRARTIAEGSVEGRRMWQISGPVCVQGKPCVPATVLLAEPDAGRPANPPFMVPQLLEPAASRVAPLMLLTPHVLRETFVLDALHTVDITKVVTLERDRLVQSESIKILRKSPALDAEELVYHASQRQPLLPDAGVVRGAKRPLKERALRRFYHGEAAD